MIDAGLSLSIEIPGGKRFLDKTFEAVDKELAFRNLWDVLAPRTSRWIQLGQIRTMIVREGFRGEGVGRGRIRGGLAGRQGKLEVDNRNMQSSYLDPLRV